MNFFSGLFWSRKLLEAENEVATDAAEQAASGQAYVTRATELEKLAKEANRQLGLPKHFVYAATYYRLDAEIRAAEAETTKPSITQKARERLDAAKDAYHAAWEPPEPNARRAAIETLYEYSVCWRTAAIALAANKPERVAANEAHLSRMKEIEKIMEDAHSSGRVNDRDLLAARYYRAQAQLLVSQTS